MSLLLKGGERMKDFIYEFTTRIYEKSAQNLILKTDKQIAVNENIICQSLFTEIEKQLKKVAIFQQQKYYLVYHICRFLYCILLFILNSHKCDLIFIMKIGQ